MLRLWICLRLSSLPLEVFRPNWSTELAVAVLDKERVYLASTLAMAAGVKLGMRRGGVQTIAPHTILFDRDTCAELAALERVTMALLQFSPNIAASEEAAVLVDVSTTLRLFGGARKLRQRMLAAVTSMGFSPVAGCAPTAEGAWLLARAGGGVALRPPSLVRKLADLPVAILPAARPFDDWLDGLGCRTLGDLRRLPRAGLQRRCGAAILEALDRAYGEAPEVFEWVEAPPSFDAAVDLPDRMESAEAALAYLRGLLVQMVGWLTARHLAIKRFAVELRHERGRAAIAPTKIEIALAEPNWHEEHLVRLLKERLARLTVEAPMIAVAVSALETEPVAPPSDSLFPEPGGTPADHARLLELLVARLGADNVRQPCLRADYRPEVANGWQPATDKPASATVPQGLPRPAWLLGKPIPLIERDHRPFYGSPLRIVSPPERLESGWWGGQLVTRDYFVAEAKDHTCYWIFQERMGSREGDEARWYLHGLFG
ncbi:DNA polymerase Y family protein [Cupriavidus sp. IK-TO18]|uniref:Y-family DNA polymerase n=1 Tax=Cupriavidus sp. IK-TO18 TaxID=2782182 RepID=UPI00189789FF|nr:DNA polymerase Y family protein [Cupriavidus sp. IK-TO18]MBF6989472.1 DNA polymerase Y family protein [Cupriavidus sp. IK-TO18]